MAGLALVGAASAGAEGASQNPALAFAAAPASGDLLIATLSWFGAATLTGSNISDTLGSTWTVIPNSLQTNGSNKKVGYFALAPSGGANTATFHLTTSASYGMTVTEWSNPLAAGPSDVGAGNTGTSTTVDCTAAAAGITTGVADCLIIADCTNADGAVTVGNTGTWTTLLKDDSQANMPYALVYRGAGGGIASGTNVDETYTLASSAAWAAFIASFKPALGAAGPFPLPRPWIAQPWSRPILAR